MIKIWYWLWGSIKSKLPAILCRKYFNSIIEPIVLDSAIENVIVNSNIIRELNYNERDICW